MNTHDTMISNWVLLRMRIVSGTSFGETEKTVYNQQRFPENRDVCNKMWKIMVAPNGSHMTIQYGACALSARLLRLQEHTQNK